MKKRLIIAAGLFIVLVSIFGLNKLQSTPKNWLTITEDCLSSTCRVVKDGNFLELTLLNPPLESMKSANFKVKTDIDIYNLQVKVFATNMNMGVQELIFKKDESGEFNGSVVFPSCIVGNMNWRMELTTSKNDGIAFEFKLK